MIAKDKDRLLKLMAYADGELDGADLLEVEAWLAEDAKAVRFTNDLANLGDLVKTGHAASRDAKAVASFDVADAVMARVESEPTSAAEPRPIAAAKAGGNVRALAERRQSKMKLGVGVVAALALAASVFVMTRNKDEQPMARAPIPTVQPSPVAAESSGGPGVDVDLVETPGHSVSVFYLPSESSLTTSVVVWVDETGEK
jgi:anti-sigma factor RsiW